MSDKFYLDLPYLFTAEITPPKARQSRLVGMVATVPLEIPMYTRAEVTPVIRAVIPNIHKADSDVEFTYCAKDDCLYRPFSGADTPRSRPMLSFLENPLTVANVEEWCKLIKDRFLKGYVWDTPFGSGVIYEDDVYKELKEVGEEDRMPVREWHEDDRNDYIAAIQSFFDRMIIIDGVFHIQSEGPHWKADNGSYALTAVYEFTTPDINRVVPLEEPEAFAKANPRHLCMGLKDHEPVLYGSIEVLDNEFAFKLEHDRAIRAGIRCIIETLPKMDGFTLSQMSAADIHRFADIRSMYDELQATGTCNYEHACETLLALAKDNKYGIGAGTSVRWSLETLLPWLEGTAPAQQLKR
jgi:hypothetical protein